MEALTRSDEEEKEEEETDACTYDENRKERSYSQIYAQGRSLIDMSAEIWRHQKSRRRYVDAQYISNSGNRSASVALDLRSHYEGVSKNRTLLSKEQGLK